MALKTLKEMNMGELWALAKSKGIEIKGKKKVQLIEELTKPVVEGQEPLPVKEIKPEPKKEEKPKKEKIPMVEATLADGTKVLVPAEAVKAEVSKEGEDIILRSVDGRELEVSIGNDHWKGKEIVVPFKQAEEVKRILKEGGFFVI